MLKLKNVSKYYYQDGVVAKGLSNVSLELHLGEFVVITGESGSGKSTLLNVLSGLDTYEDGEMYINGEETSHYTEEDYLKYRRSYVSNIFQNFNLVNSYTVYENIELAFLLNGYNRREVKDKVNALINQVDLKKYKNTHTSKLSGGQKQRVAIARALANDTPIIIADEPTGSLDSKAAKSILKLLKEIATDKLVIVVTHNKSEIIEYATRLIKMHDGSILENKIIEKIDLDDKLKSIPTSNISLISKIRLGLRNAFNLPIKFLLMVAIFLLITITLITNYGAFKMSQNEEISAGYSPMFNNSINERIIIKKPNQEAFTEEDYTKISNISNIAYLVKDDLTLDYLISLNSDYLYLDGYLYLDNIDHVDEGRMPTNDDEIVVVANKDNWYVQSGNLIDNTYESYELLNKKLKIVGILYDNNMNYYDTNFVVSDNLASIIKKVAIQSYSQKELILNKEYLNGTLVLTSKNVKDGYAYITDSYNYYCDGNCQNKSLDIRAKNIYEMRTINLKVGEVINQNNYEKLLGIDEYTSAIYISENDYNNLYDYQNYQSSIIVDDMVNLDKVVKQLEDFGYVTVKMNDIKINDAEMINQIYKVVKLVVTVILVLTLFFISYFIIRIIYKSRNSYYTTLRTLGSTKGVCIKIMMDELITLASITFILFSIFMVLVSHQIIKSSYFYEISKYVTISDYLIVYLILILLSILMALRYGRKIFKDSIIKTYGERI